ncbi:pannexin-3 [Latimeria chalumnae]
MSIARTAAEYMLSDSLVPDTRDSRLKGLCLELPLDRTIKFVSVGLPLLLVSLAFAREITLGIQITCFPPSNFSIKQSGYVDTFCWDSLIHHEFDADGFEEHSLWIHKVFPYLLLLIAVTMYLPAMLWKYIVTPALGSELLFIIDELDKSYNRSIRLSQHILHVKQTCADPLLFRYQLDKARRQRYFEFPLLERYLACKQCSYYLVGMYILRNFLLLIFIAATCLYLVYFHLTVFFQNEFSCYVKTGLLFEDTTIPDFIQCKLTSLVIFQLVSVVNGAIYVLMVPLLLFNLLKLCCWDKRFLYIYEMLPAFDLLSRKMLSCPINDLNVILLFLRANINELKSFGRLSVLCALRDSTSARREIDTVVDMMTVVAGSSKEQDDSANNTAKRPASQEKEEVELSDGKEGGEEPTEEMPSCSYA